MKKRFAFLKTEIASYGPRFYHLRPRTHKSVFKRKGSCFAPDTAIVHTTTPKTITRKTESFENALQTGAIGKQCFLKTLFSSVDGVNDAI